MRKLHWAVLGISFALVTGAAVAADGPKGKASQTGIRRRSGERAPVTADGPTIVKSYYVGDLLSKLDTDLEPLTEMITSTIAKDSWIGAGSGSGQVLGSITPFPLSLSLIVRQTPEAQEEVANLLRNLRKLSTSKGSGEP